MGLHEEIKNLSGNKRRFFLLRIADLDTKAALKLCGVKRDTYNSWLSQKTEPSRLFVSLYRRRDEFNADYKQDAIKILRRDNQLEAVLLEGQIVAKMKEELASGEYSLVRSQLAREVYSKLITDLDAPPPTLSISWEERLSGVLSQNEPEQLPAGEIIEGEFIEKEAQT